MARRSPTLVALVVVMLGASVAAAQRIESEVGLRGTWVDGSAVGDGDIAGTGSSPTLSSGPGVEGSWLLRPLELLGIEVALGVSAHPIGTSGGSFDGLDGGTLWRIPISAVAQYRPPVFGPWDPYVGVGVGVTVLEPGLSSDYEQRLSEVDFSNEVGLIAQLGVDYTLDLHWAATLDLRYAPATTTGSFVTSDGSSLDEVDFDVNAWTIGLGFRYRY